MNTSSLLALASFAIATTFTPGPNNLIVATLGIQQGLRRTWPSIFGVVLGFFLLMTACGFFAGVMLELLPAVESWVRWLGAAYILWLAYQTMTSGFSMESSDNPTIGGFWVMAGFQFLNPKAVTFGLTVFSAFLGDQLDELGTVMVTVFVLASLTFASLVTWASFGSMFKQHLRHNSVRKRVRIVVGLLLLYVAVDLVWP